MGVPVRVSRPFTGPTRFEGLESTDALNCNPRALRQGYLDALNAHTEDSIPIDVRIVAATKVELVLAAARRAGHPLQCIMEAA